MEYEQENTPVNYWNSVLVGATTVALITGVMGILLMYYVAGAEPSMMVMVISGLSVVVTCLFGLIGGLISTRHYAKTFDITFSLGTGALIGLYTGILAAVFATIFSQLWLFIDPSLIDNYFNNMIYSMSEMGMPADQLNQTISSLEESREYQNTIGGILAGLGINALVLGIVNTITGLIGAKIFASED